MAEIFDGVGLLRGGGRQVGTTGKLPESSVEYSSVQIFTRDRFEVTKREGKEERERERGSERETERQRKIKRKGTYNNPLSPVVTSNVSLCVLTSATLALKIK